MLCHKIKKWLSQKNKHLFSSQYVSDPFYPPLSFESSLRDYGEKQRRKREAAERAKNYLKKSAFNSVHFDENTHINSSKPELSNAQLSKQNDPLMDNKKSQEISKIKINFKFEIPSMNNQQQSHQLMKCQGQGQFVEFERQQVEHEQYSMMFEHGEIMGIGDQCLGHKEKKEQINVVTDELKPSPSVQNSESSNKCQSPHYASKLKTKLSSRILSKKLKNKNFGDLALQIISNRKLEFISTFNLAAYSAEEQQQIIEHLIKEIVIEQENIQE